MISNEKVFIIVIPFIVSVSRFIFRILESCIERIVTVETGVDIALAKGVACSIIFATRTPPCGTFIC